MCHSIPKTQRFLARPPIMSSPEPDEVLFAYIAVAPYAVSLVLIRVNNGVQRLVYYVSKSLHEAAVRYLPLEKGILAVVLGTRKLPHYFQTHTIVILTQLPLKTILQSADYTGKIAKWGTILGVFDIKYIPHTSIKGQVLADLVAEFTEPEIERITIGWKHGWKISLYDFPISPSDLGSICRRSIESERLRGWASTDVP